MVEEVRGCEEPGLVTSQESKVHIIVIVKLRQGSGKDRQGMAVKAKGLKALTLAKSLH